MANVLAASPQDQAWLSRPHGLTAQCAQPPLRAGGLSMMGHLSVAQDQPRLPTGLRTSEQSGTHVGEPLGFWGVRQRLGGTSMQSSHTQSRLSEPSSGQRIWDSCSMRENGGRCGGPFGGSVGEVPNWSMQWAELPTGSWSFLMMGSLEEVGGEGRLSP